MNTMDRRAALLESSDFNGIDFVEVANDEQTALRVHFLNGVPVQGTVSELPTIEGGESIRTVAVEPVQDPDWGMQSDHVTLDLRVAAPGDFSNYSLRLQSGRLDPFFDHVTFSFKARCP